MKAKKAAKRLKRVEALLGSVRDEYDGAAAIDGLLGAALSNISDAVKVVTTAPAKKPPVVAKKSHQKTATPAARKRLAAARATA